MDKYGSHSDTSSARSSPTQLLAAKSIDSPSSGSSSRSQSPQLHPKDNITTISRNNSALAPSAKLTKDSAFQIISVCKGTSLGLNVVGGIDRNEGPLVYIQEIIPGGDCDKDGRLKPGDQLVSINKESMIGVSYEEAKTIINRTKMRYICEGFWEIAFIRQKNTPSYSENLQRPSSLVTSSAEYGEHQAAILSSLAPPNGKLVPTFSPNAVSILTTPLRIKTDFSKQELQLCYSTVTVMSLFNFNYFFLVIASSQNDDYEPQGRNSTIRLRAEKLERALNYLGIQPTDEQQQALRQQLQKDSKGTVSFGDFVEASRNLFSLQSNAPDGGQKTAAFGVNEIASLLDSQFVTCDSLDDMERLKKERIEALKEMTKLKEKLSESENLQKQLTEELQIVKQEAKAAVEETRALRSRIHLAEAAQRQARGMEMDYEEVICLLEAEIVELKAQLTDHSGQNKDNIQDLRKRVTVLDCQLRKSESARKTFEVATEKLLQFVEVTLPFISSSAVSGKVLCYDRRTALSTKALLARLGRIGPSVTAALAAEARDLAKSVRAILEVDCLPYGWEEAYTADGIKYFINHVTQTTSWIHPVTSALSLLSSEDDDDGIREVPGSKS
ncbi:STXB4 protein, partial [Ceuthmochares aereus]|nr:STXB4 protein [Ceuthmochares aereus]